MTIKGPNLGTGTSQTVGAWTNPNNVLSSTDSSAVATTTLAVKNTTNILTVSNFGLAILDPDATIQSVSLSVNWFESSSSNATLGVRAVVGGSPLADHTATRTGSLAVSTFDLTGDRSWMAADFSNANFAVQLEAEQANTSSSRTYSFDYVTVTVTYQIDGAAILSGDSDFEGDASVVEFAEAALSGEAALSADAQLGVSVVQAAASLSGNSALAANAVPGTTVWQAAAALAGAGSLKSAGQHAPNAAAKFNGAATFVSNGTRVVHAAAGFSGAAILKADSVKLSFGATLFGAAGALAVDAVPPASPDFVVGKYDETGEIAALDLPAGKHTELEFGLLIDPTQCQPGDVLTFYVRAGGQPLGFYGSIPSITVGVFVDALELDGSSSLSTSASVVSRATALLAAQASLAADASHRPSGAARLSGESALEAAALHAPQAAALLQGAGTATVSATVLHAAWDGAALLAGNSALASNAEPYRAVITGEAAFAAASALLASASHTPRAVAEFIGSGDIDARGVVLQPGAVSAEFDAVVALKVNATHAPQGRAAFAVRAELSTPEAQLLISGRALEEGRAGVGAEATVVCAASAALEGRAEISTAAVQSLLASAFFRGAWTVSVGAHRRFAVVYVGERVVYVPLEDRRVAVDGERVVFVEAEYRTVSVLDDRTVHVAAESRSAQAPPQESDRTGVTVEVWA